LAHVALNLFTNYVNVALAVPVDFPPVRLRRAACARPHEGNPDTARKGRMSAAATGHPRLPDWHVDTWLNAPHPLTLQSLRGRVVLIHAFQMLCPGCVATGLPQAQRVRQAFPDSELAVIGLHTVFEHHEAMSETALRAFVHEYRWSFPIGIDRPSTDRRVPQTMFQWGLQGTPSHIVL